MVHLISICLASSLYIGYQCSIELNRGFAPCFVNYKKGALDSLSHVILYQLLAHGRWFPPGTPASSTTKNGHHDIAEILKQLNQGNDTACVLKQLNV
jgi:hypothetical protein